MVLPCVSVKNAACRRSSIDFSEGSMLNAVEQVSTAIRKIPAFIPKKLILAVH